MAQEISMPSVLMEAVNTAEMRLWQMLMDHVGEFGEGMLGERTPDEREAEAKHLHELITGIRALIGPQMESDGALWDQVIGDGC